MSSIHSKALQSSLPTLNSNRKQISKKPSGENFSPWQGVGGLRERVWERGNPFPELETAESLKELESLKISQEYLLGFQYV